MRILDLDACAPALSTQPLPKNSLDPLKLLEDIQCPFDVSLAGLGLRLDIAERCGEVDRELDCLLEGRRLLDRPSSGRWCFVDTGERIRRADE